MPFEILKILIRKSPAAVSSAEILSELGNEVSEDSLNEVLESLERHHLVTLHAQNRSAREPKYDLIVLTKEGHRFAEHMGKTPSPQST